MSRRPSLRHRAALAAVVALFFAALLAAPLAAQEGETFPTDPTEEPDINEAADEAGGNSVQEASLRFFAGERLVKKAEKALEKAGKEGTSEDKREKLRESAREAYEGAIGEYLAAIQLHKQHPKAYAALGDVWRKTGQVEQSLQAYEAALVVDADDPAALAGRIESHLHLGQLEAASADYQALAASDAKQARKLLESLKEHLAARRAALGEEAAPALDAIAEWIEQTEAGA